MKHGFGRTFEAMRKIRRDKVINKNRILKEKYDLLAKNIDKLTKEKEILNAKIDLYCNRKNYYQFLDLQPMNNKKYK